MAWSYRPELLDLESRTLLSIIAWLRPVDGDWDTGANWAGGRVPGFNDTAVIPFRGITVTHATAATDTIQSLNTEAALDISAGSLTFAGNLQPESRLDALVTVTGGTLSFIHNVTGTGTLRNFATLNLGADISEQFVGNANVTVDNEAGVLTVFGVVNNDANRHFVNGSNATLRVAPGFPLDAADFTNGFTNQGHIDIGGLLSVANGILVNAPSGTIVGRDLAANVDNQGTITDSHSIGKTGGTVTNEGTITVHPSLAGHSVLGASFGQGGTINGDGGLTIRTTTADFLPGAVNTVASLAVIDSTLNSPTPLTNLTALGDSTINAAVVNQSTLTIRSGFSIESPGITSTINGPLTNAAGATLVINGGFGGAKLTATQALVNNGSILLVNGGLDADIAELTVTGGTLVNAPGATISGGGNLNAALDNQGTLSTTDDIVLTGSLTNSGTINVGTQFRAGDLTVNLTDPSAPFTNTGTIAIRDVRAAIVEGGDFANTGTVTLGSFGTFVVTGNYMQTAGLSSLSDGILTAGGLVDLEGGVLAGTGVINASVLNNAELDVGQPGSPGILTIVGDYTQTSGGVLVVEIGGPSAGTDFDQLNITGQATLDGTLTVHLINGFVPSSGDSFTIVTFGGGSGTFANINGDGALFTAGFDANDVTLVAN
jgi:hypothetical protein